MRNDGRRRVPIALVDHRIDVIGGKYLERACQGGFGQRVCVYTDEQRAGDAVSAPVTTDRLADRKDMCLIEGVRIAVPADIDDLLQHAVTPPPRRAARFRNAARMASSHRRYCAPC